MWPFKRLLLLALFFASLPLLSAEASSPEGIPPQVQLSLFNDAGVPAEVLAPAKSRVSGILRRAGVQVEWTSCRPLDRADFTPSPPDCSVFGWPEHLCIRIVRRGISVSDDVFGMSFLDESGSGVYATIYYQNLVSSKEHPELNDSDMLGYAMVHEVGHLLLGPHSHSAVGVMKGSWQKATLVAASRGTLFFSESEANLIRTRLATENRSVQLRTVRSRSVALDCSSNFEP